MALLAYTRILVILSNNCLVAFSGTCCLNVCGFVCVQFVRLYVYHSLHSSVLSFTS